MFLHAEASFTTVRHTHNYMKDGWMPVCRWWGKRTTKRRRTINLRHKQNLCVCVPKGREALIKNYICIRTPPQQNPVNEAHTKTAQTTIQLLYINCAPCHNRSWLPSIKLVGQQTPFFLGTFPFRHPHPHPFRCRHASERNCRAYKLTLMLCRIELLACVSHDTVGWAHQSIYSSYRIEQHPNNQPALQRREYDWRVVQCTRRVWWIYIFFFFALSSPFRSSRLLCVQCIRIRYVCILITIHTRWWWRRRRAPGELVWKRLRIQKLIIACPCTIFQLSLSLSLNYSMVALYLYTRVCSRMPSGLVVRHMFYLLHTPDEQTRRHNTHTRGKWIPHASQPNKWLVRFIRWKKKRFLLRLMQSCSVRVRFLFNF